MPDVLLAIGNHLGIHCTYGFVRTQEHIEEKLDGLHVVTVIQVGQIERLVETWNRKRLGDISGHVVEKM